MDIAKIINGCKQFNRAEEIALCKKMKQGDLETKNKLFMSCAPWAILLSKRIAYSCYGKNVDNAVFEDMQQIGLCGLLESLEKFDHTRGCRLTTFAAYYIRKECLKWVWNNRVIRIPLYLQGKPIRRPSMKPILSLNTLLEGNREHDGSQQLKELSVTDSPSKNMEDEETLQSVHKSLKKLSKIQQEVLKGRLQGKTLLAIGKKHGLTRERIRQIEKQTISKLKRAQDIKN